MATGNIFTRIRRATHPVLNILRTGVDKLWYGLRLFIQGDGVSARFFWDHIIPTTLILGGLFLAVAMRFQCISKSNKGDCLEGQINVIRTEKQRQRALYKTLTRESAMMHLVDSLQLGLSVPDKHPQEVVLRKNK